jgi:hypothetical protein
MHMRQVHDYSNLHPRAFQLIYSHVWLHLKSKEHIVMGMSPPALRGRSGLTHVPSTSVDLPDPTPPTIAMRSPFVAWNVTSRNIKGSSALSLSDVGVAVFAGAADVCFWNPSLVLAFVHQPIRNTEATH